MVALCRGTRKLLSTGLPAASRRGAPSDSTNGACAASQAAWRVPEDRGPATVTRKPPSSASALEVGAVEGPQASTPRGFFWKISSAISRLRLLATVEHTEV